MLSLTGYLIIGCNYLLAVLKLRLEGSLKRIIRNEQQCLLTVLALISHFSLVCVLLSGRGDEETSLSP